MNTGRLTRLAILTSLALVLFTVELQIPMPVPIAGVKLGLANIVTLFALYRFSVKETILLVTVRVFLGCLFAGNLFALVYSYSGALLCMCAMLLMKRAFADRHVWLISVVGAVFHNIGQLAAAAVILGSAAVFAYLPILLLSGCIAGAFTGLCAGFILDRTKNMKL